MNKGTNQRYRNRQAPQRFSTSSLAYASCHAVKTAASPSPVQELANRARIFGRQLLCDPDQFILVTFQSNGINDFQYFRNPDALEKVQQTIDNIALIQHNLWQGEFEKLRSIIRLRGYWLKFELDYAILCAKRPDSDRGSIQIARFVYSLAGVQELCAVLSDLDLMHNQ